MIYLYDIAFPWQHRWIPGDQHLRKIVRRVLTPLRGKGPGGLAKVTANLILGLEKLGVPYRLKKQNELPKNGELCGILHGPKDLCADVAEAAPCVVGPGILNSPNEWPDLFSKSKAIYCVQNCEWAADMYRPLYGERVKIWKMGIDQDKCAPSPRDPKQFDLLIYDKIRWPDTSEYSGLLEHCRTAMSKRGLKVSYIRYGEYPRGREESFHDMLRNSRAMLFLSENETQGFAYNEALSFDVPILAWNLGKWCDPNRSQYGVTDAPATSIPYWDSRCGVDFRGKGDFSEKLDLFLEKLSKKEFAPREYVLANLRIEQGAERYLEILKEAASK